MVVVVFGVIGVIVRFINVVGFGVWVNVGIRVGVGGIFNGDRFKVGFVLVVINLLKLIW